MKTKLAIADRVANLTAQQKSLLAAKIQEYGLSTSSTTESGRQTLTAWVVEHPQHEPKHDARRLRKQAFQKLPAAMVPRQFRFVKSLPKTSTGKLDRNRLQNLNEINDSTATTETRINEDATNLSAICADLLGVENVADNESFFDLGGDSFLSIRLVALARQAGFEIEPKDVVESASIAELAARGKFQAERAADVTEAQKANEVIELRAGNGNGSVMFAHEIGGECHYAQYLAEHLSEGLKLLVTKQSWNPESAQTDGGLEALAAEYTDKWLQRDPKGPHNLVSYCWGGLLAYEISRQFHLRGRKLHFLATIEFGSELAYQFAPKWNRLVDRFKGIRHRICSRVKSIGRSESLMGILKSFANKILSKHNAQPLAASDFNFSADMGDPKLIEVNFAQYFDYPIRPSDQEIHLFRSPARTLVGNRYIDSTYGWRYLVGEKVVVQHVSGGHSGCIRPPHASELGKAINLAILQNKLDAT